MRKIDIETCQWLSPRWLELIRLGYRTELLSDDRIAVMARGLAARDYARNVLGSCYDPYELRDANGRVL